MARQAHARRDRRPSQVVGALAVPFLVVTGLALWHGGAEPSQDASTGSVLRQAKVVSPVPRPPAATSATSRRPGTSAPETRSIRPISIAVPSLGVRAAVLPIRVVDRALTPPDDPRQLGWWSEGARPGSAEGTAVLTGHTVHTGGGALDDLEDVSAGDAIWVTDGDERVSYDVTSVRVMSREAVATRHEQLFRQSGPHRLLLITCENWDGESYRSAVVVRAVTQR